MGSSRSGDAEVAGDDLAELQALGRVGEARRPARRGLRSVSPAEASASRGEIEPSVSISMVSLS